MNVKKIAKISIDVLMTIILIMLMVLNITNLELHEWIGIGMLFVFIIHNALNYKWYKNIFKGSYSRFRTFALVINIAVLISMVLCMISGIMMSGYVFKFLSLKGNTSLARKVHMSGSYSGFVLISVHLGIHWKMIISILKSRLKISKFAAVFGIGSAAYGAYAFFKNDIISYMFLTKGFVSINPKESLILLFIDYFAMMAFAIFVAHCGAKLLRKKR